MATQSSQNTTTSVLAIGDVLIDVPPSLPDLAKLREQLETSLAAVDEEISRRLDARGGKLVSGAAVQVVEVDANNVDWTQEKNARRCELIDKDIQGTITPEEKLELVGLTRQRRAYRRKVAPLPIDDLKKLHKELLEKSPPQCDEDRGR